MEDEQIIELYINRDERAIKETKDKYGSWIYNTALSVLDDFRDAAECENETYYKAWRRITDGSLRDLRAYLMRIARNEAYSVLRKKNAGNRKGKCSELYESDCVINAMTSPLFKKILAILHTTNHSKVKTYQTQNIRR